VNAAARRARPALAVIACAACLAVTACGAARGASSAGGPGYRVQARSVAGLGRVLTDADGFTLYIYVPDHDGKSRCYGECARQWPPLVLPRGVSRPTAGRGVRAALLGLTRRANGTRQVTYNGWPLYLYQGDHQPGQATGQADDMGLWYVLSVTGSVDHNPVPGQAGG
jgi:predicted lipoprotein with Yx(FWY)xxD motif